VVLQCARNVEFMAMSFSATPGGYAERYRARVEAMDGMWTTVEESKNEQPFTLDKDILLDVHDILTELQECGRRVQPSQLHDGKVVRVIDQ
jgi:hypothetical protein